MGHAPPGPGGADPVPAPVARTAAAMSARSSSFSSRFAAGSQPSTCRGDLAPTMALVTPGNESVQAMAMAAGVTPWRPDPDRFAAEFSGSERTVAEYLLAEVLERQSEQVRLLLLRTSALERVNGELADLLTGQSGGEREDGPAAVLDRRGGSRGAGRVGAGGAWRA